MNKLYDDSNMTLLKLNEINALLDKSLDHAWKLCCVKKRKKHKIINDEDKNMHLDRYTNIVNDKLDLVNQIGELVDSYVSDAYNIVDGINKCHNNSSLYYILEEDLKKCKENILKLINGSNVYNKPDTKKKDSEPDIIINDKPDTKKKDSKKKDTKKKNSEADTKKKDGKKKDNANTSEKKDNVNASEKKINTILVRKKLM